MPTNGWGNIYCNSFSGDTALASGGGFTGLLDEYSGAAAAYSLRLLRSDYTGSAIRVRRSSDNTEQDIGFVDNELDTASLLSFVGAGDGFVTTWYDQSGGGNDATQASAAAQPQVVSSGSLLLENGKPTIDFEIAPTTRLINSSLTLTQPETTFTVHKFNIVNTDTNAIYDSYDNIAHFQRGRTNTLYEITSGSSLNTFISTTTNQSLTYCLHNGINSEFSKNESSLAVGDSGTNGLNGISIGNLRGNPSPLVSNYNFKGTIQEIIIYNSDQSANRTAIETNINSHYAIYPDVAVSGLLFDYPGASAAYSLRQLTIYQNGYKEKLVRVRRDSDNAEVDVFADSNYEISLNSNTSDNISFGTWIGANDGYVTTWYDQSGGSNDAIQATAANQPQVVSSGALITENGKPTIDFNNKRLAVNASIGVNRSIFAAFSSKISSSIRTILSMRMNGGAATDRYAMYADTSSSKVHSQTDEPTGFNDVYNNASALTTNLMYLQTYINNTNRGDAYLNSLIEESIIQSYSVGTYNILIGYQDAAATPFVGDISDLIIYPSDQSSNRTAIETNINNFYSIY